MKPHFKLCILLTYALLCASSIIPRRARPSDITPYLRSLGIPLIARQDASCLSEEECGEGHLCAQLNGEPYCKTDCSGFCLPEKGRGFLCNCDLPCETGVCTDPIPGEEQPDNGLCSEKKDRKPYKCPGKKQGDGNTDKGKMETPPVKGAKKDRRDDNGPGTKPTPGNVELEETPSPQPETDEMSSPQPSTDPAQTPQPESSGVCISSEHLSHLPRSSLVFREDILAHVLCDTSGSCATGGHMVLYGGHAMLMRRYCERVGCEKRVMRVNSPVYERGRRVRSRSTGLRFTALAARFETTVEEGVLRMAVGLGL